MTDFALAFEVDPENPIEGDLRLVDGQLVLVSGLDAIRQDLMVRLRWFKNEWFLDRRQGLPWFERILGHKTGTRMIERILRAAIMSTPGVVSITQLRLELDEDRTLTIDFEARTTDGPLEIRDFILSDSMEDV